MSLEHLLLRFGTRSTQVIAKHFGQKFPFYLVSEYPKAGGTWLAQMIADYLRVPLPKKTTLPLGFECVIHNHWGYSRKYYRPVYVVRDGRDQCVSMFFHLVRIVQGDNAALKKYIHKKLPEFEKRYLSESGEPRLYPDFVRSWIQQPVAVQYSWNRHVLQWWDKPDVHYIKYEDLLADPHGGLADTLKHLRPNLKIDEQKLDQTVQRFSFKTVTGRNPGEADNSSFVRKGIAGDWRNHFDSQCCKSFHELSGDVLLKLGYESNESWWQQEMDKELNTDSSSMATQS